MLGELTRTDLIRRITPVLQSGWYIRPEDGKIVMQQAGVYQELPWIFVELPKSDMSCKYFHDVCHGCFNFIHSRCMTCWKVVFRPKTVEELLLSYDMMRRDLSDIPSKCGVERREYVHGNYGCYFYGTSKDNGLENWHRIFKAVSNDPKLRHLLKPKDSNGRCKNLILKRACTEFEMSHGDSTKWAHTDQDAYWEETLEEVVEKPNVAHWQPFYVKDHIKREWLKFAYGRGDATALIYNKGELFYPDYVKYHPRSK